MNGAASCHTIKPFKKSVFAFNQSLKNRNHVFVCFLIGLAVIWAIKASYSGSHNLSLWSYYFLGCLCVLIAFLKFFQVTEESLLLIYRVGLQTTTVYVAGKPHTKYIPWCAIQDVVINEAVSGFRMVHYLAVIVKEDSGELKLVPILLNSRLRLPKLKQVYQEIQKVLKP